MKHFKIVFFFIDNNPEDAFNSNDIHILLRLYYKPPCNFFFFIWILQYTCKHNEQTTHKTKQNQYKNTIVVISKSTRMRINYPAFIK